MKPKYLTKLDSVPQLTGMDRYKLSEVSSLYAFRANEYYLSLIDWDDPDDPIRRIIIPDEGELDAWGRLDASNEKLYTRVSGLEHKYEHTAILLVNKTCGGFCRFCFRKRLFMNANDEVVHDVTPGLQYIREHKELNNILITGGDPLLLSTKKLENIIRQLREIDHVQIIRIGTKMPAFNPYRILDDPSLAEMLGKYSLPDKKVYIMVHFNHPNELTDVAVRALHLLQKNGIVLANQTPIIRGVNDSSEVLGALFDKLSFIGVPPYYVFQCRPTQGNRHLAVPIEQAYVIHEQAKMKGSGLAKRSRFVMSHSIGKIEVLGMTGDLIIFRLHRAAKYGDKGYIIMFKRNPEAYWYDDYSEVISDYALNNPFHDYGIESESTFLM